MPRFILALIVFFCATAASHAAARTGKGRVSARLLPGRLGPAQPGQQENIAVILRCEVPDATAASPPVRRVRVSLRPAPGISVGPRFRAVSLRANVDTPVFFRVTYKGTQSSESSVAVEVDSEIAGVLKLGACYSLDAVSWKSKLDRGSVGVAQGWMSTDFDDSDWAARRLPSMWNDIGVTYLRARLFVPDFWRGRPVFLRLKAVDDHDICYLNGVEIGRTNGWDVPREYEISPDVVKYGEDNLLCIAVNNGYAGGGIYRTPNYFGVEVPAEPPVRAPKIAPPGPVGDPLPFQKVHVRNGVLVYQDGREVALWGVDYYPQSWYQYQNMKRLGVDMKKAIRDDLDDMKRMGVEVIRIHVFDREISDRAGNLLDNEHLDLLDYLISEGSKRGIYFMFTPIAWWWGPDQNPDSFSARTPKEYMYCDDEAMQAQANYLKNWLNHVNRYTARRYKDEPAICTLEIMNEPAYADYNMMTNSDAGYYRTDPEVLGTFRQRLIAKWRKWYTDSGLSDEPRFFPLFRYRLMSDYLDAMYKAIRHTGAKQPVACALFHTTGQDDLTAAIADSRCEAVTTGLYAGSWDKVGDGVNYLPWTVNTSLDARLDRKARLVYEFDGIKTFGSYFYPACARRFRNLGVQIACMFQYDSRATAEWNTDWDAHYLNLLYTPNKAVSFRIGGKVFRELKRGQTFPTDGNDQVFGNCAVSFDRNISIYSDDDTYAHSAPCKDWRPLPLPERPRLLIGVGDSPFVDYDGTGIYTLILDYATRKGELTVHPDADIVGDSWHPDPKKSAVILKDDAHPFSLSIPGIDLIRVTTNGPSGSRDVRLEGTAFQVRPGLYGLAW